MTATAQQYLLATVHCSWKLAFTWICQILAMRDSRKRPLSGRDGSLSPPPLKRKIESVTTSEALHNLSSDNPYCSRSTLTWDLENAVASFFTPVSQKEPERTTWRVVHGSLLVGHYRTGGDAGKCPSPKRLRVAGFDFVLQPFLIPSPTISQQLYLIILKYFLRTLPSYDLCLGTSSVGTQRTGSGGIQACLGG